MTKWLGIGVVPMFSLVTLFAQLDPQLEYEVIRPSSKVEFFVGASLGDINGVFASYDVEFRAPTPRFEDSSFAIEVAAQSVHTGSGSKDKMVKGKHFFWVDRYPTITFVSRRIVEDPGNAQKFSMEGDFTIRGVTKPVTLALTVDPQTAGHARITADLSFDRREFGMTYNMAFNRIADSVRVRFELDLQGIAPHSPSAPITDGQATLIASRR